MSSAGTRSTSSTREISIKVGQYFLGCMAEYNLKQGSGYLSGLHDENDGSHGLGRGHYAIRNQTRTAYLNCRSNQSTLSG